MRFGKLKPYRFHFCNLLTAITIDIVDAVKAMDGGLTGTKYKRI
jgi:hypothetical protein